MSSSSVFSVLGWSVLPNLATDWLQSLWYGITIRAGSPRPQPGSRTHAAHRRRIYIVVISLYLAYTIFEVDWELRRAGDFYRDLGLAHAAPDRDIKARFRRLAAQHHPDKSHGAEHHFVHLKLAHDTLLDPARRFAYDRLGPEITTWKHLSTMKDFARQGLQGTLLYYALSAVVLAILGVVGVMPSGGFWRWLTLLAVAAFEVRVLSSRRPPWLADALLNPVLTTLARGHPPYLPFQLIQLARRSAIAVNIALSQLGPVLAPPTPAANPARALHLPLDRLAAAARALDVEAARLMALEMAPFAGDAAAVRDVRAKVKEWLVQNTIRSDPEVRDAMGRTLRQRRRR